LREADTRPRKTRCPIVTISAAQITDRTAQRRQSESMTGDSRPKEAKAARLEGRLLNHDNQDKQRHRAALRRYFGTVSQSLK
jgi:hypothetical protein